LACLVAMELGGGVMARWLGNSELSPYTSLLGLYLLFWLTSAALEIVMIARKRYRWASWSYALLDLLRAGLLVVPALVAPHVEWVLMGAVMFAAIRCAVTVWYFRWEFGGALRPDGALLRLQLAYAVPFQFSGLVEIVQANLHQYAVAHYFDAATFAIYSVGCLQIPLVEVAFGSVVNVMMVRMAEELRDGRGTRALAIWHDSSRKLALLFFPLTVLLVVTARPIVVFLFTERYAASTPIFMVSSLSLLLAVLMVDGVLRVYAETRFLFALNVARLLITLTLIGALVGRFGLVGAILATVIAAAAAKAIGLARIGVLMKVKTGELLPWRNFAKILGAALAAAGPALLARHAFEPAALASLVVAGFVYGAAYLAAVWWLGALSADERLALRGPFSHWGSSVAGPRA
jgi:O-antigen/teichoic acid export membrane protein